MRQYEDVVTTFDELLTSDGTPPTSGFVRMSVIAFRRSLAERQRHAEEELLEKGITFAVSLWT